MMRLLLALVVALAAPLADAALNLNTATKDELVALSGIGPAKAQAILDYRVQHGGFKSVDELKDVKGIGARRFEKLKPELTVAPAPVKTAAREAKPAAAAKAEAKANKEVARRGTGLRPVRPAFSPAAAFERPGPRSTPWRGCALLARAELPHRGHEGWRWCGIPHASGRTT